MALVLTAAEVANFAGCSEKELRQAIADGHHFRTLGDAFRHFETKRPGRHLKSALEEATAV
jgi:hypothetical protein